MPLSHLVDKAMSFYLGRQTRVISRELLKPGKFDPVAIFGGEHFWTKYTTTPHEDLALWEKIDKWLTLKYRSSLRYERVGLLLDDLYDEDKPEVAEAVARLPQHVAEARQARISRAVNLTYHNTWLPKEEWTKPEDDVPYLLPYLRWVKFEFEEKEAQSRQDHN